ncbi:Crp/Fnr family transcriptional regulator [Chryseobacterium aquaticum]|uniref:Crp/Fnr family transcriptional regulator n=1 Tax=Chryseobacterium aquaticum TaxID=452084 RepID=A0A848MYR0_9FLAO|nr:MULTISPECIES: Crp/Fnr family transcriptional regulator [Chryseobacterium]NMR33226.1 Crp/Fnr family transcriptional regulator [Chryseobacterium aquaticum]NRQ44842.1 Crp/Fnr family transcriptional regulator [Chryseobacterium sp. C-204]
MLAQFGNFSDTEVQLFNKNICKRHLEKNEILSKEGDISKSIFFITKGSFYQSYYNDIREEKIITDLYLENEWTFDLGSLINQSPAKATITAFEKSEVMELTLDSLHKLIAISNKFLQFNKLLISNPKLSFYDENMTPTEKYNYILKTRPQLIQTFTLSMIASYLKIRPETISRIRANVSF